MIRTTKHMQIFLYIPLRDLLRTHAVRLWPLFVISFVQSIGMLQEAKGKVEKVKETNKTQLL